MGPYTALPIYLELIERGRVHNTLVTRGRA